jgi:hypothetical protein
MRAPTRQRAVSAALALCLAAHLGACKEELGVDHPEGAFLAFRDALLAGDAHTVWTMIDEPGQQVFEAALADLVALSESVNLLSPGDQAIVRAETGLALLEATDDAEGLFGQLTHFEYLVGDDTYRQGTEPDRVVYAPGATTAEIVTESGQTFWMTQDEAGAWRVSQFSVPDMDDEWRPVTFEGLASQRLAPIAQNVLTVEMMVAQTASSRRSPAEIEALLGGGRREDP